jgi:3alpha(or 20beta)-hydroxysteroid dehydrogenase
MGRLKDKVAIITGGSQGQGASHVRKFVEEGAKVVFTDISVEKGQALEKEIGENVKFVKHDVANEDDWKNVVAVAEETFGPVNVLVNNAGISIVKHIADLSEEEYRKVMDVNQVGVFLGMKTVLPSMKKAEKGSIINLSSTNGFQASPGGSAYDSSKFAVRGITKSAALEFAEFGIRVNSVHPGPIQTPFIEAAGDAGKEQFDQVLAAIPMKRIGQAEEISNLILFLASDESSFSTGSEFIADGGMMA